MRLSTLPQTSTRVRRYLAGPRYVGLHRADHPSPGGRCPVGERRYIALPGRGKGVGFLAVPPLP